MERMNDKLDGLWAEYRTAVGDPDAGPDFMPGMWRKIEARRSEATVSVFRRFTQFYVAASVALTIIVGALLLPGTSSAPSNDVEAFFSGTYVEILAADRASDLSQVMPVGDYQ
jgi:hypothetical protein